ncbi:MAG: lipopolysaccharide biosynthesis protein [Bacillota bacterium]|uniref:lipopolysaccharide biosynthesis protein n=1 Tax=unclassified Virgibacillus TaxID=2620237 RepID=UPI0019647DF0|nr:MULTISPECIES: polysaccharide biosynthesis C-terminal domain-containing protein [unclassified Virgibacillus]MCC2248680.1 oligosaccharide flippase family protein [Virgibacillus sp. AGTR]MDY7044972.1 oligosaccharide flippase family protein [Virgibacillus sp. M23]QRZ18436.1 oligosaccharide flippase family protein [Virgibacillus sp. AGTR]
MAKGEKLAKDTILYSIATFGSKALVFFMLPVYTHYFTTDEYGTWDLVLTTSSLLAPIISFELVSAVYRWLIVEKEQGKQMIIITSGVLALARNLIVFTIIALICLALIPIPYGLLMLTLINLVIVNSYMQQCARGLGFNTLFASIGLLQTTIYILLIIWLIFGFQMRIEAFFYAYILANMIAIITAWTVMRFHQYISFNSYSHTLIKSFLTYAIPIIPGAISWWIMNASDRFIIVGYLGLEFNGLYAIANQIPAMIMMINTVFNLAWKDSAILHFNETDKNNYYSNVFQHFFRLLVTSVICITLLTKPIFSIFISEKFFESWQYTGLLLVGTMFSAFSLFWSAGFHGAKKTKVIFVTSIVGAFVNILVHILFISSIGLYAAAWSTLIAFFITWIIRVFTCKPYFTIHVNLRDMAILFPLLFVSILAPFFIDSLGLWILSGLAFILFFIYNLTIIRWIIKTILYKYSK